MMRSLYTAATGMRAQQTNVDNISNNIANVNTTGYKNQQVEFKSLLYQTIQTETTSANGNPKPVGAQAGLGTRVASNTSIYTQGPLQASESLDDFAIEGDGFFSVRGYDGETYYTRNGDFGWSVGNNGITLCTTDGYAVLDSTGREIIIPNGISADKVIVDQTGAVSYINVQGNAVALNQRMGIYQFNNPAGLDKIASSLLRVTEASGAPLNEATNNALSPSIVHQSYLEASNVDVANEMVDLIVAQRAYELNSKAITTSDEMLEQANNLKR